MHKFALAALALVVAFAAVATPAQADEDIREIVRDEIAKYQAQEDDPKTLKVYYDNGLKFKGKEWKGQIFGRLFFDVNFIDDKDYVAASGRLNSPSGTEFRRLRLGTKGQWGNHVAYKLEVDWSGNDVSLKDAYINLLNLRDCVGCGMPNILIGHTFEQFGLEQLTSSKYITFIERSIVTETFSPERSSGILAWDVWRGGQMGYGLGVYANQSGNNSPFHAGDGDANLELHGWAVTGRYWWAPWFDCDCACKRLHVGVSMSYRGDISGGALAGARFRARPGVHTWTHRAINTGIINAENILLYGAEIAWVYGPWSLQAEYMGAEVSGHPGTEDASFWGWYAQASYWLTGECRKYKNGVFKRVDPCCNWLDNDCCCKGGWEIAARYNFVDLVDGAITGGEMTVIEGGVNWHLNPMARIMLNVVWANVDASSGVAALPAISNGMAFDEDIIALTTRFQVDF